MKVKRQNEVVEQWQVHPLLLDGSRATVQVDWVSWVQDGNSSCSLYLPCATDSSEMGLPMDPMAATFWALTCWSEQQGSAEVDAHGRPTTARLPWTACSGTISFGEDSLSAALQHRWPWIELMWTALLGRWGWKVSEGLTFQPTVDVDVAFKHLGRSRTKSFALQLRDFFLGRWGRVIERRRVLRGEAPDPYDTYAWLKETHSSEPLWWFVLVAHRHPPFDIGLDPKKEVLPQLVESLSWHPSGARVAWHPGYRAMDDEDVKRSERERFSSWNGTDARMIRAHFLRSEPGRDWESWEAMGVREDASLGWARDLGFRAGTSRSFPAYSVKEERALELTIHPIAVMDSALRVGLGWSPERAAREMDHAMTMVSKVGGTWLTCWHNTSVSDDEEWSGWRATYLHMVKSARRLA